METIDDLDKALEALMLEAEQERDGSLSQQGDTDDNGTGDADYDNDSYDLDGDDDSLQKLIEDAKNEIDNDQDELEQEEETKSNEAVSVGNENSEQSIDAVTVNVNGVDITLNSVDEIKSFINSQKQLPKQDLLKDNGLSPTDVQLLLDIKAGNVSAIHKAIKDSNIDLLDIESFKGEYIPQVKLNVKTDIDYAIESIQSDKELSSKMETLVPKLPKEFVDVVGSSAKDITAFAQHVKGGIFEKVYPEAVKAQLLKGGSLIDHYNSIGAVMFANKIEPGHVPVPAPKANASQREVSSKEKELRKRASMTDRSQEKKGGSSLTVDDIWNMTPEELSELDMSDLQD